MVVIHDDVDDDDDVPISPNESLSSSISTPASSDLRPSALGSRQRSKIKQQ
jgi:hypothetical protein